MLYRTLLNIEAFNLDCCTFLLITQLMMPFLLLSEPTSQVKKIRTKDDVRLSGHSAKPV